MCITFYSYKNIKGIIKRVNSCVIKCEDQGALQVFKGVPCPGALIQLHVSSISGKAPVLKRALDMKATSHRQGSCLCLGSSKKQMTILGLLFFFPKWEGNHTCFFCVRIRG